MSVDDRGHWRYLIWTHGCEATTFPSSTPAEQLLQASLDTDENYLTAGANYVNSLLTCMS